MKRFVLLFSFILLGFSALYAQEREITGKVTGADDGAPIAGANVLVAGTNLGTITMSNGEFSIEVPEDAEVLTVSFIGYEKKRIPLEAGKDNYEIQLAVKASQMDEVVVTALGIEREKKALGYSVTDVSGDDINKTKEDNVVDQLSGRVPGLVITKSAAGPGSGSRVTIRGNNSLTGNNQPLYVVDGVPIDNSGFGTANSSQTANYSRIDYGTGISDINPDDIESISVLKGPNAAALYGSRASNGVVLITTKKGGGEGLGVSYSGNFTFKDPLVLPEYQNEYGQGTEGNIPDYEQFKNISGSWGPKMDGSEQLYYTGETRPYEPQENNVENFFRTGSNITNSLALDYGSENASMRFSYTNMDANSILENSGLTKHNFNIRGTAQLSDRLSVDAKATYFEQNAKNRPTQGTEGLMAYVYDVPRNLVMEDLKDYQNEDYSVKGITENGGNPYWILHNDVRKDNRQRFSGFAKATYEFADFLSAFARVGTDRVTQEIKNIEQYGHWFFQQGRFNFSTRTTSETNADFLFMFDKSFGGLNVTANFGGNARYGTYKYYQIRGEEFKIPEKPILESARNVYTGHTPLREKKVHSLYGSATIDYRSMMYLEVSGRNDWSSALPEDERSYFYPSASFSLLPNEIFDMNDDILSYSKLRFSWAQVGNDTEPYQLTNSFNLESGNNSYLGRTVLTRPSTYYTEIGPEQTTSIEFGAELRFFNNRLYLDASYYDIASTDLIMQVPVPEATGYQQFNTNVGELSNVGYEFMLGGQPIRSNGLTWDISVNMAHNENELVELMEDLQNYTFSTTNAGDVTVRATVGGGFGEIWGTGYKRTEGGEIIVDDKGRPMEASEKELLGNYQPDWTGGINNTINYKGLSMSFLIDFRIGGELYSGTDAGLDAMGVTKKTLEYREEGGLVVDGVVNTGDEENPVYEENTTEVSAQDYWGAYSGIASNYVFDQTNFRLRELTLSYSLPQSLLGSGLLRNVSIGVVGRNLFFIHKELENFDPESSYSTSNYAQGMLWYNLPTTRSIGFNVNIEF